MKDVDEVRLKGYKTKNLSVALRETGRNNGNTSPKAIVVYNSDDL